MKRKPKDIRFSPLEILTRYEAAAHFSKADSSDCSSLKSDKKWNLEDTPRRVPACVPWLTTRLHISPSWRAAVPAWFVSPCSTFRRLLCSGTGPGDRGAGNSGRMNTASPGSMSQTLCTTVPTRGTLASPSLPVSGRRKYRLLSRGSLCGHRPGIRRTVPSVESPTVWQLEKEERMKNRKKTSRNKTNMNTGRREMWKYRRKEKNVKK